MSSLQSLRWATVKVGAQRLITFLAVGRAATDQLPWWEQSPVR